MRHPYCRHSHHVATLPGTSHVPVGTTPRVVPHSRVRHRCSSPRNSLLPSINFARSVQAVLATGKKVGRGLGGGPVARPYTIIMTTLYGPIRPSPPKPGEGGFEHRCAIKEAALATVYKSKVSSYSGSTMSIRTTQFPYAHHSGNRIPMPPSLLKCIGAPALLPKVILRAVSMQSMYVIGFS